jgi:hypothetical protein
MRTFDTGPSLSQYESLGPSFFVSDNALSVIFLPETKLEDTMRVLLRSIFVVFACVAVLLGLSACGGNSTGPSSDPNVSSLQFLSASPASGSTRQYGRTDEVLVRYNVGTDIPTVWSSVAITVCVSLDGKEPLPFSCEGGKGIGGPSGVITIHYGYRDSNAKISRTDYIIIMLIPREQQIFQNGLTPYIKVSVPWVWNWIPLVL